MSYDVILIVGEVFFDHPLCGTAILKRLLEKNGYSVAVIEKPSNSVDVKKFGVPNLFFGISSGAIDSMVRNYTPLKKKRFEDPHSNYVEDVKDRAVIVYTNWVKEFCKDAPVVLGGTESTLRRFSHFDYWENRVRRPILFDAKADILVFGSGEKQILEISSRLKKAKTTSSDSFIEKPVLNRVLGGILGSCIISSSVPKGAFLLPAHDVVVSDKSSFCDLQLGFSNDLLLAQKVDSRYCVQFPAPVYSSCDLDEYYELPFSRLVPKFLRGFEFSVVTHRGCFGGCSFCALKLIQGEKIISRSKESILRELSSFKDNPNFRGNVDDLGGPSANMYGMDCSLCDKHNCLSCKNLDRSNSRLIDLLKSGLRVDGIKNIFVKSGIRYDLASDDYVKQLVLGNHIFDTLRIAPEHVNVGVLDLMNKNVGDLDRFVEFFESLKSGKSLSYYFITAHPGSSINEAKELALKVKELGVRDVQVFIPTPMTLSTCMYYTGLNPKNKESIYVPYSYREKKVQKRVLFF